ncbi:MAG: hypothetical protein V2A73_18485, partial [Pseudomonadota bacterium]
AAGVPDRGLSGSGGVPITYCDSFAFIKPDASAIVLTVSTSFFNAACATSRSRHVVIGGVEPCVETRSSLQDAGMQIVES